MGSPYTVCTRTSPGSPPYSPVLRRNWNSGIKMLWYGMNMPNKMSGKMTSDPRKRHLDSTYPFMEPMTVDKIVALTARMKLLRSCGAKRSHATA